MSIRTRLLFSAIAALCLVALAGPASALPVFPGAEGYGTDTVHGRGGIIVEVTNLNDSGAGSLRDACENYTIPRIIVFRVGGTITLTSGNIEFSEANSYAYIAGQTAPGDGIQLKGDGLWFHNGAHDVVVRHLRIRAGSGANSDCITVYGNETSPNNYTRVYNIVVDHCSLYWAADECASTWDYTQGVTFQWCIFAESEGNYGFISGHGGGSETNDLFDKEVALHHNLFAHNQQRNPYVKQGRNGPADIRNNVVYNWGNHHAGKVEYGQQANFVGNYYIEGPDTGFGGMIFEEQDGTNPTGVGIYVDGNIGPFCLSGCSGNEWDIGVYYWNGSTHQVCPESLFRIWSPYLPASITTQSASDAYTDVLNEAGATLPSRDALDDRIVSEVVAGTGSLGKSSDWPALQGGTPPTDSDHDAMPDSWETTYGLNPNDASDRNGDLDGDGYTNVEEYLNGTNPGTGSNPPVADFSGNPSSGTAPLTVNFSDLSTNNPTSWDWTFGDSGTSTAQNPSHDYTSAGDYTVGLTAANAHGSDGETKTDCISVTSGGPSMVTVYPDSWRDYGGDQTVTITSGSLADVDADDDVYMVAACNSSSQQSSMEFHFSSGYSQSEVSKIRIKYDLHGTNSSTPTYMFFMKQGDSSSFTEVYSGTYSTSDQVFTWETTDIATYLGSGGGLVTSICGCPQNTTNYSTYLDLISIELEMVGGGPSPPVADFSGSPTSGDYTLTVNFTDLSTNTPTSWDWTFGDGGSSTAQNPSHDYTSAGDHTVSLTAANAGGSDSETKTNYISVTTPPPPAPVADFSGSPTSGDYTLTVNFTDLSTNTPTSWDWTFGDGGSSTAQNPSHDYTSAGNYTVSLTAANAGGSDSETKTNYISVTTPPPPAPVADFSGSPTSGDYPLTVSFTDLSTNSPTSWDWTFGDGGSSTAQNPSHDYTSAGDHTVSLTAANAGGSDSETKTNYISVTDPGGGPATFFSDDFEAGLDWNQFDNVTWYTGSPKNGTHGVRLRRDGAIDRTISTVGYQSIRVTFYMGAYSLDKANENVQAHWYDGSNWNLLKQINNGDPEEDQQLHYFQYDLASGADNNANFAFRFRLNGSGNGDYGYVDDVVVQGTAGGGPSAPVANFSGSPTSGTAPLTVNFTDLSTNSPTSWDWNFGDSGTSTAQNPSHDYTSAGDYTVSLTATNAGGSDSETKTDYISVSAPSATYAYPTSNNGWCGSLVSGAVADVQSSDDSYFTWRCGGDEIGGVEWIIDTSYTPGEFSNLTVEIEMKTSRSDTPYLNVHFYNVTTSGWDLIRNGPTWSTTDQWFTWSTGNVSDYMTGDGVVRVAVGGCGTNAETWDLYLDVVRIKLDN